MDDLETSRWIAGGFPALLTWSAMKNTPNYIVPMRTNRSDAANPLFFWWVKFRSSWREKRSGFDAFFEKKVVFFFPCPKFVSFSWWKKSFSSWLQDELTYQRKAELKLAVHCTRRHFHHQRGQGHENHLQLEFRSRIVEMDADERDGAAQPTSGGLIKQKKNPKIFTTFQGFFEKKRWKIHFSRFFFRPIKVKKGKVIGPWWKCWGPNLKRSGSVEWKISHGFSSGFYGRLVKLSLRQLRQLLFEYGQVGKLFRV